MAKERGEGGEYVETVTLDDVRGVFDVVDGPVILSADVADELGCSRETARRKLEQLFEQGDVERRKVARRVLYWRPETDESGARTGRESAEGESAGSRDEPAPAPTSGREGGESEPADVAPGEDPETVLRELGLPGSGGKLDARIDAILRLYEHLREHPGETVAKVDLLALVDPDDVAYGSAESFWNNCVKANASQGREQNALVALPGVEDWGGGEYRYSEG
jgi:hypothetical protein